MSSPAPSDEVTQLLDDVRLGRNGAVDALAAAVYEHLHRIASNALRRESASHTLQPTELVNEAYLRLMGQRETTWQSRAHFFAVAARTIRRILVDHARRKRSLKRDYGMQVTLDEALPQPGRDALDVLALDEALHQLERFSERQARVVELRFFAGLGTDEAAEVLGISERTVKRDWVFARAFLLEALSAGSPSLNG